MDPEEQALRADASVWCAGCDPEYIDRTVRETLASRRNPQPAIDKVFTPPPQRDPWDPKNFFEDFGKGLQIAGETVVNTAGGAINDASNLVGAGDIVPQLGTNPGVQGPVRETLGVADPNPANALDAAIDYIPGVGEARIVLGAFGVDTSIGGKVFGEGMGMWGGGAPGPQEEAGVALEPVPTGGNTGVTTEPAPPPPSDKSWMTAAVIGGAVLLLLVLRRKA